jgi:hypothetical protein
MKYIILLYIICITNLNPAFAQCPPIVVNNTTIVDASCPSGGEIRITATGSLLQFAITSGPTGYLPTTNSTGIFTGLLAGAYTIRITDNCGIISNVNVTVSNTYAVFSVSSHNITNSCTSFTRGGTINATITGGKSPYQYDIVPIGGTPVYGSNTTSTTYAENVSDFGNYRIYAKDACGEVRTRDIEFTKTQDKPFMWWTMAVFNRPCGEIIDGLGSATLYLNLFDEDGYGYNASLLVGARVKVYRPTTPNSIIWNSNDCTTPTSTLISNFLVNSSNLDSEYQSAITMPISRQDLVIHIETLCGDTAKFCYDFNEGLPDVPYINTNVIQRSCGATWNDQTINIVHKDYYGLTPPLSFTLIRANSTQTTNSTGEFYSLPTSTFPATYRVTDACGRVINNSLTLPTQGSALSAFVEPNWNYQCTNAKTAVSANIIITNGDLPGILQATNITITGGPASIIPSVGNFDDWIKGYVASNLVGGYTYIIRIQNTCGERDSISFNIPLDNLGQSPLNWNMVATKSQLCGNNVGTINASANYSGSVAPNYLLYNLTAPNTVIQSNYTGTFNNVPPGDYKVKFVIDATTYSCPNNFIRDSTTITILDNSVGQSITKKTVFNCESAGSSTGQGKAIIEVNGTGPFTYEIIRSNLIGTGSEVWNESSTNNPSNNYTWDLPRLGDPVNTIYTLRSTDACGNKITTMASLQPLSPASSLNDIQPCVGQSNYSFGIAKYAGNGFTYRWVKLPDLSTTISTNNDITFAGNYTAASDGTYRCFVSHGTCVERTYDFILDNNECGKTLPVLLHSFNGSQNEHEIILNWSSQHEQHIKHYIIERSKDGLVFESIAQIGIKSNRSILNHYKYIDQKLPLNFTSIFYRIKLVDYDYKETYSTILRFSNKSEIENLTLSPNPVRIETILNFRADNAGTSLMQIFDQTGNIVDQQNIQYRKGYNSIQTMPNVMAGVYVMKITIDKQILNKKFIKL